MKRILVMIVLMIAAPALALSQTNDKKADATKNKNSSVEQELMQLEKDSAAAAVKGDTTFLDRHTAANYIGTDPGGGVEDRATMLANAKDGNPKFETLDLDDMSVRMAGKDTAVVTGRATIKGKLKSGMDISGQYRFTDVWVKQEGRWQLMAWQATKVAQQ
ncbi:MAG: nuclear transport factor 2 family protein [Pyrinomonadaceae bacterium]|nr:nuclear transport factor 2 family protein [Pyrinomonadaceae bacterium]